MFLLAIVLFSVVGLLFALIDWKFEYPPRWIILPLRLGAILTALLFSNLGILIASIGVFALSFRYALAWFNQWPDGFIGTTKWYDKNIRLYADKLGIESVRLANYVECIVVIIGFILS